MQAQAAVVEFLTQQPAAQFEGHEITETPRWVIAGKRPPAPKVPRKKKANPAVPPTERTTPETANSDDLKILTHEEIKEHVKDPPPGAKQNP